MEGRRRRFTRRATWAGRRSLRARGGDTGARRGPRPGPRLRGRRRSRLALLGPLGVAASPRGRGAVRTDDDARARTPARPPGRRRWAAAAQALPSDSGRRRPRGGRRRKAVGSGSPSARNRDLFDAPRPRSAAVPRSTRTRWMPSARASVWVANFGDDTVQRSTNLPSLTATIPVGRPRSTWPRQVLHVGSRRGRRVPRSTPLEQGRDGGATPSRPVARRAGLGGERSGCSHVDGQLRSVDALSGLLSWVSGVAGRFPTRGPGIRTRVSPFQRACQDGPACRGHGTPNRWVGAPERLALDRGRGGSRTRARRGDGGRPARRRISAGRSVPEDPMDRDKRRPAGSGHHAPGRSRGCIAMIGRPTRTPGRPQRPSSNSPRRRLAAAARTRGGSWPSFSSRSLQRFRVRLTRNDESREPTELSPAPERLGVGAPFPLASALSSCLAPSRYGW